MKTNRHSRLAALLLGSAAACAILSAPALAAEQSANIQHFDIPPQDAAMALNEYARQAGVQIVFPYDYVRGRQTPSVQGDLTRQEALAMLTTGLGLKVTSDGSGVITLRDASDPQSGSAAGAGADQGTVAALIVTAQKKEENIQDVPIAISAFTEKSLETQKIETGGDLLKAIPNVTFSKNNFSGYNFSIRGIGTKAVSVTTDPGVAVSFNNTTLIRNRLFEQEYFDIERVEVLRGPQGTLYGRNATSGVVNVISAKPTDEFGAQIKAEVGNYNSRRLSGWINVPIFSDKLDLRVAGAWTKRDGYDFNAGTNHPVDGRDLWSGRVTLAFNPTPRLRSNLIWERFDENDDRARTGKQLCRHDPGPSVVDGVLAFVSPQFRGLLSQGCLDTSLYSDAAYGTPNGLSIPFIQVLSYGNTGEISAVDPNGPFVSIVNSGIDPYGNKTQSHDLRTFVSRYDPKYRAQADIFEYNLDFDLTPGITFTSQTAFDQDKYFATQDYNRFTTYPIFANAAPGELTPGGIYTDPQLGPSDTIMGVDISQARSQQFSQEFRLQSHFSGKVNFSAGLDYTRYKTLEDYYVFFNAISLIAQSGLGRIFHWPLDPNPLSSFTGQGHNYFRSENPYQLRSGAVFGEIYWQASDSAKITAGLRYTDDRKHFTPIPSETLLFDPVKFFGPGYDPCGPDSYYFLCHNSGLDGSSEPNNGYPALPPIKQEWREVSGRLNLEWQPQVSFTDHTMVYASYARGYKGGGANPPGIGRQPPPGPVTFKPEFNNAFEVGTKNTLLGGSLVINGDAFFYDYKDYQVSKIVDRSALNENFDATIWGLEFESVWQPMRRLRFNVSLGYLDTKLGSGSRSIDLMDRTAGHSDWVVVKPSYVDASNCIAPAAIVAKIITVDRANGLDTSGGSPGETALQIPGQEVISLCPGGGLNAGPGDVGFLPGSSDAALYGVTYNPATDAPNGGAGFYKDVSGHELPNSPHWTQSIGAQYTQPLSRGWEAMLRADFYHQSQSWARIYEDKIDKLHGWKNANVVIDFSRPDSGLQLEVYCKNIFNSEPITDTFLNSDDTSLTTNIFTLDPRIIGVSLKKDF